MAALDILYGRLQLEIKIFRISHRSTVRNDSHHVGLHMLDVILKVQAFIGVFH